MTPGDASSPWSDPRGASSILRRWRLRVIDAFGIRGHGTAIVVGFTDDEGRVWAGDVARVPLVSGEHREVGVRSLEFADGRDANGRLVGHVALRVDGIAAAEIAREAILETRRLAR